MKKKLNVGWETIWIIAQSYVCLEHIWRTVTEFETEKLVDEEKKIDSFEGHNKYLDFCAVGCWLLAVGNHWRILASCVTVFNVSSHLTLRSSLDGLISFYVTVATCITQIYMSSPRPLPWIHNTQLPKCNRRDLAGLLGRGEGPQKKLGSAEGSRIEIVTKRMWQPSMPQEKGKQLTWLVKYLAQMHG